MGSWKVPEKSNYGFPFGTIALSTSNQKTTKSNFTTTMEFPTSIIVMSTFSEVSKSKKISWTQSLRQVFQSLLTNMRWILELESMKIVIKLWTMNFKKGLSSASESGQSKAIRFTTWTPWILWEMPFKFDTNRTKKTSFTSEDTTIEEDLFETLIFLTLTLTSPNSLWMWPAK